MWSNGFNPDLAHTKAGKYYYYITAIDMPAAGLVVIKRAFIL